MGRVQLAFGRLQLAERVRNMPVVRLVAIVAVASLFMTLAVEVAAAQRYRAQVQVTETPGVGVNPTTEMLDFGDMCGGTEQTRYVTLDNAGERPAYVVVWTLGGIGELIDVHDEAFVLEGGASERVSFCLNVPSSAPPQMYTGTVFVFRLPYLGW